MKKSRTKGAAFEREIANRLTARFGCTVQRILGQARDGGSDLEGCEPWTIECKRRRVLPTIEGWLEQARVAAPTGKPYVVIARSDGGEPIAIMPLAFWEDMVILISDPPKIPDRVPDERKAPPNWKDLL